MVPIEWTLRSIKKIGNILSLDTRSIGRAIQKLEDENAIEKIRPIQDGYWLSDEKRRAGIYAIKDKDILEHYAKETHYHEFSDHLRIDPDVK